MAKTTKKSAGGKAASRPKALPAKSARREKKTTPVSNKIVPRSEKATIPIANRARTEKVTTPIANVAARSEKPTLVDKRSKTERSEKPTLLENKSKIGRSEKPTKAENLVKAKAAAKPAPTVTIDEHGLGWIEAGKGYQLTLDGQKLAAKNDKGKRLSSVPKELKDGDVADQLEALRDWLIEHDRECITTVEQWMLRSLPVPRAVLQAVWEDPSWRRPLENAVVVAVHGDGGHDHANAGLFRGVDPKRGIGVVDIDGETAWLEAERVAIPHPILIAELDAWRELVTQLDVTQGVPQLHRETHPKPAALATGTTIDQFESGKFAMLMHAIGKARALGYKIRGGFATCKVWDAGAVSEARYWIGADSPDSETYTGQLSWVDARERSLPLAEVGPVAFSEGMRMASAIYAARVVEKQEP